MGVAKTFTKNKTCYAIYNYECDRHILTHPLAYHTYTGDKHTREDFSVHNKSFHISNFEESSLLHV